MMHNAADFKPEMDCTFGFEMDWISFYHVIKTGTIVRYRAGSGFFLVGCGAQVNKKKEK